MNQSNQFNSLDQVLGLGRVYEGDILIFHNGFWINSAVTFSYSGSGITSGTTSGTSGSSGRNGFNGTSGTSGTGGSGSGSSGSSGINGSIGSSGTNGTDGTNGTSGSSGISGTNGTSGSSGSSGTNGTSGSSGSSGTNGTSGTDGTSGSSGTNGAAQIQSDWAQGSTSSLDYIKNKPTNLVVNDGGTPKVTTIVVLTQAAYTALGSKDSSTLYVIVG